MKRMLKLTVKKSNKEKDSTGLKGALKHEN